VGVNVNDSAVTWAIYRQNVYVYNLIIIFWCS